jgi:LuxR family transcriptional regulator, maltose regulon positive regulatory protein
VRDETSRVVGSGATSSPSRLTGRAFDPRPSIPGARVLHAAKAGGRPTVAFCVDVDALTAPAYTESSENDTLSARAHLLGGEVEAGAHDDPFRRRPVDRPEEPDVPGDLLGVPLLRHKLRPPHTYLALVQRRALVDWLLRVETPLLVFSAPAGCGKTSSLVQWAQAESRPVAWLSLDPADGDPAVFLSYLAAAIADVTEVPPAVFALLRQSDEVRQARACALLASAVGDSGPFVLVLDDCHNVRSRQCWDAVVVLAEQLHAGGTIALSGRRDPPLRLARLRTSGGLSEVRMERLAMDAEEAGQLLRLHGAPTDADTLAAVMEVTEGWAAGVYLAAVLAEPLPSGDWLRHLRGDQREIARYLTAEVLARQPQRVRSFLEQTSILERLNAELCRAVTGRQDAGAGLERAASQSLFVTALDDRGEWYRYHHLFAELLRAELARHAPELVPGLHRAAAAWLQGHREPEAAVSHWLAAGDLASAMAAVRDARESGLIGGRGPGSARLLRLFSDEQILSDTSLTLFAGWIFALHWGTEEEQRLWGTRACRMEVDDGPSPMGGSCLRSYQALLRSLLAPDGVTRMVRDAELAVRLETDTDRGWYLLSRSNLAITLYLAGRDRPAAAMLEDLAVREPRGLDRAIALNVLSLLAGDQGDWERAEALDRRAMEEDPELVSPDEDAGYLLHFYALASHCRVLSRRADPARARYVEALESYRARMIPRADYILLWTAVILGDVFLEHGDLAGALRWSGEALDVLRRYPDAGILGPRARRLDEALQRRRHIEPLTPAERHVLELLPTHLTADQIAARLFVSTNTVRTHMQALHRKLSAATRAETVTKAIALGLLPPSR